MKKEITRTKKITQVGNSLGVTITKEELEEMKFKKGDYIMVTLKKA